MYLQIDSFEGPRHFGLARMKNACLHKAPCVELQCHSIQMYCGNEQGAVPYMLLLAVRFDLRELKPESS